MQICLSPVSITMTWQLDQVLPNKEFASLYKNISEQHTKRLTAVRRRVLVGEVDIH